LKTFDVHLFDDGISALPIPLPSVQETLADGLEHHDRPSPADCDPLDRTSYVRFPQKECSRPLFNVILDSPGVRALFQAPIEGDGV
jgi:hypothetical protein